MARVIARNIQALLTRRRDEDKTRLVSLVTAMAQKMRVEGADDPEFAGPAQDVAPERRP